MHLLNIQIQHLDGQTETAEIEYRRILNLGYTTRDPNVMERHLQELREEGIDAPVPAQPPLIIPLTPAALSTASELEVQTGLTSGEVELVMAGASDGRVLLGVGSDHTDRALERVSIGWSKQVTPNVVGRTFWQLDELDPDLAGITMLSWVRGADSDWREYQNAPADTLLAPAKMLEACASRLGISSRAVLSDSIVFSGTVHSLSEEISYDPHWRVALRDQKNGREISLDYQAIDISDNVPAEWRPVE